MKNYVTKEEFSNCNELKKQKENKENTLGYIIH